MNVAQTRLPSISVITAVLNREDCINNCIESVVAQRYPFLEHIIVDGGSTDGTLARVRSFGHHISQCISEPDEGLYDAMNKGIQRSTGEIIACLNSDDIYHSPAVLDLVAEAFKDPKVDAVYGDIVYVDFKDPHKIVRHWKVGRPSAFKLWCGWQIPHPGFFMRRKLFEKYGAFDKNFRLAADYELILRMIKTGGAKLTYLPQTLARMRTGGESNKNLKAVWRGNVESLNAWKKNQLLFNPLLPFTKPLMKLGQIRF